MIKKRMFKTEHTLSLTIYHHFENAQQLEDSRKQVSRIDLYFNYIL